MGFLNNDVTGSGGDGLGMGGFGAGFMGGIFGGFLTRLFGNGNNDGNGNCNVLPSDLTYQMGVNAGSNAEFRDLAAAENSINATTTAQSQNTNSIIANGFATTLGFVNTGFDNAMAGISKVGEQVITNGFMGQLLIKDVQLQLADKFGALALQQAQDKYELAMQQAKDKADLTALAVANQYTTNMQFKDLEIREMTQKYNDLKSEDDFNSRGLFRATGPMVSVVQNDPCSSKNTNETIVNMNNNINAIGSTVQQIIPVIQALQNKMGVA